jgi:serpin B
LYFFYLFALFLAVSQTQADLSLMDGSKELYVSAAFHKAFIDVNEEGTEAAAATAMVVAMRCAMRPMKFVADRPFVFFIYDSNAQSVLFIGRMSKPE